MVGSFDERQERNALAPRSGPRWTGPFGDERAYRIDRPDQGRRGGIGVVYEAVICSELHGADLKGSRVGLKLLTGMDDYRWQRLEERSPALAKVHHPNLSRHLGVFAGPRPWRDGIEPDNDDPQRYSVHLWVEGQPLAEVLDTDPDTILTWMHQVAQGIDHLHADPAGPFAHRDLHPRNVIIKPDGEAVVIDFDLVFAGKGGWIKTRPHGSRFAPLPTPGMSSEAVDRGALAKIALHAFAGDGEGAFDDIEVVEAAARRLRKAGFDPEPAVALLTDATARAGGTTSAMLISEVDRTIRRQGPRSGIRRVMVAFRRRRGRLSDPPAPAGRRAGKGESAGPRGRLGIVAGAVVLALVVAGAMTLSRRDGKSTKNAAFSSSSTSVPATATTASPTPTANGSALTVPSSVPLSSVPTGGATSSPEPAQPRSSGGSDSGIISPPLADPPAQPPAAEPPVAGEWGARPSGLENHCSGTQQSGPNLWYQICWSGATPMIVVTVTGITGKSPNHALAVPRVWTVVNGVASRGTSCPLKTVTVGQSFVCIDATGPSSPGMNVESFGRLQDGSVEISLFSPRK